MRPLLIRYPDWTRVPWIWSMLYFPIFKRESPSSLERHGIIKVRHWGPFMLVTLPRRWVQFDRSARK